MRRSWSVRLSAALLAVWFGFTPAEGATVPACPTHAAGMHMPAHMSAAGHTMHGQASQAPAPAHDAPAHGSAGAHRCCPGACTSPAVAALTAPVAAGDASAPCSAVRLGAAREISARGVGDHFLPFPSGPPSLR